MYHQFYHVRAFLYLSSLKNIKYIIFYLYNGNYCTDLHSYNTRHRQTSHRLELAPTLPQNIRNEQNMDKNITNSKLYLNILFYKNFVTLLTNLIRIKFKIHCNHVHTVSIVFAFYFVYKCFINIWYRFCIKRGFSSKTFAK